MVTGRYHWSNGAHSARFFVVNAIACIPLLGLILHPSWFGLWVTLGTIAFLFWVERIKNMSVTAFFRSINVALTGRVKSTLNLFKEVGR